MHIHSAGQVTCLAALLLLQRPGCAEADDVINSASNGSEALVQAWTKFKDNFRKNYNSSENAMRFGVWLKNKMAVEENNAAVNTSFVLALNRFADWTQEEYKRLLGFKGSEGGHRLIFPPLNPSFNPPVQPTQVPIYSQTVPIAQLPTTVNWTAQGRVNPVQDQGQCGDCWAFAACGAMEGQYSLNGSVSAVLSEQNLLDCTGPYGNEGCDGGSMEAAFSYVMANKGIDSYRSYPYTGVSGACRYNASNSVGFIAAYQAVAAGNELALQQAVALIGPVAVGIDASLNSFQLYKSGVYAPPRCSTQNLDHAVLVVGYGALNGQDYWLIKNSWGTDWGIQGYMLLARNAGNMCGVATQASFPSSFTATGVGANPPSEQGAAVPAGSGGLARGGFIYWGGLCLAAFLYFPRYNSAD